MSQLDLPVLVLNLNYEPLNVCTTKRAMVLLVIGKAEVIENGRGYIRTPSTTYPRPSVIRLGYMIRRPRPRDHVVPRHRGGEYCWENLVSACPACNRQKGGKTLQEAHMSLLRRPYEPRATGDYLFGRHLKHNREWGKFITGW
jgi:5-methylcytosine-specific restriction endonuclease McrA